MKEFFNTICGELKFAFTERGRANRKIKTQHRRKCWVG
jgi:hypothetical protein